MIPTLPRSSRAKTLFTIFYCDCGNPGVRKKSGCWVCERCLSIEVWLWSERNHVGGLERDRKPESIKR